MDKKQRFKLYDFVVLPARGIYATHGHAHQAIEALSRLAETGDDTQSFDAIEQSLREILDIDISQSMSLAHMRDRARLKDFSLKFTNNRLDGGPISVKATAESERMLRSVGFRVLKQRQYSLISPASFTELDLALDISAANRVDFRSELYLDPEWRTGGPLGAGVTIGIVDTGVDMDHPALAHAVKGGRCFVPGESNVAFGPSDGECGWHGTHVAGIVSARDDKGRCPDGVAPEASLRSYRVFGGATGTKVATIGVIDSILAAVDDGCDIVNLSLGGRSLREDGVRDAINYAWDSGVVCVAAAGNGGRVPVGYPAAHPNCIGISAVGRKSLIPAGSADLDFVAKPVSAVDPDVFLASFTNVGPQIDFAGPGVGMISTLPKGGFGAASGTSMAAPAITGAAAVALSRDKTMLNSQRDKDRAAAIFALLVKSARPFKFGSFDYEGYVIP